MPNPIPKTAAAYKLHGHMMFQGLDISIENRKGSTRRWYDPHGKETGSTKMHCAYGYIKKTKGTDGDHVDVYVGPKSDATHAFIVNQNKKPEGDIVKDGKAWTKFDEQKVMLGFVSAKEARAAYDKQYDDPRFFGSIKAMPMDEFKEKVLMKSNHGKKVAMWTQTAAQKFAQAGLGPMPGQSSSTTAASPTPPQRNVIPNGKRPPAVQPPSARVPSAPGMDSMPKIAAESTLAAASKKIREPNWSLPHKPTTLAQAATKSFSPMAKAAQVAEAAIECGLAPHAVASAMQAGQTLAKAAGLAAKVLGGAATVGTAGAALVGGKKAIDHTDKVVRRRSVGGVPMRQAPGMPSIGR